MLCLSGNTVWGRFRQNYETNGKKSRSPIKTTPITLVNRVNLDLWKQLSSVSGDHLTKLSHPAKEILAALGRQGASFFEELVIETELLRSQVEEALAELVAVGMLTADSYTGLRALLVDAKYRSNTGRRRRHISFRMEQAGRWSLLKTNGELEEEHKLEGQTLQKIARVLLKRYGVVVRKLADRENLAPAWRDLVRIYRTMEARGEIRGGRFVDGVWGEQYALPEAVTKLRSMRKEQKNEKLISISAADPLNLTGILGPGKRVSALFSNRILYRDGIPIAVKEGKEIKFLKKFDDKEQWQIRTALIKREISPKLKAYLGKGVY
jgi:ATP-dependent Lhr-like helicase